MAVALEITHILCIQHGKMNGKRSMKPWGRK